MTAEPMQRLDAISTRWSLLHRVHAGSFVSSTDARAALVLRYLPAVRRYVAAIVRHDQDTEDIAQDIMVRLLKGDFAGADPTRGRFRDLLKMATRNIIRDHWRRQSRRRSVDYDVAQMAGAGDPADDVAWTAEWRGSVLDLVWNALEQRERRQPSTLAHTLLRLRVDHPDETSEQLATRLAERTGQPMRADTVRQRLHRARLQFVDLLLAEVAGAMEDPSPETIQEELASLGLLDLVREFLPAGGKEQGRAEKEPTRPPRTAESPRGPAAALDRDPPSTGRPAEDC